MTSLEEVFLKLNEEVAPDLYKKVSPPASPQMISDRSVKLTPQEVVERFYSDNTSNGTSAKKSNQKLNRSNSMSSSNDTISVMNSEKSGFGIG